MDARSHSLIEDKLLTLPFFFFSSRNKQGEASKVTERQHKKNVHFGGRKFVLKA